MPQKFAGRIVRRQDGAIVESVKDVLTLDSTDGTDERSLWAVGAMTRLRVGEFMELERLADAAAALPAGYPVIAGVQAAITAEDVRDIIGAALQAGANVTVTPNDAGDTITISSTAPASTGGGGLGTFVQVGAVSPYVVPDGVGYVYMPGGGEVTLPVATAGRALIIKAWEFQVAVNAANGERIYPLHQGPVPNNANFGFPTIQVVVNSVVRLYAAPGVGWFIW